VDPLDRIIWSADVADEEALMGHLDRMPELRLIKIDRLFVTDVGLGVIDRLNERGLKVFADVCHKAGTRPCAVTVLTSKSPGISKREFRCLPATQVLYYVEMLLDMGFTDIVCSPKEVPAIRSDSRFDELGLNTPGIVLSGATSRDQARTNTPEGALEAGSTRLVIGSAITKGDPAENLRNIVASIAAAA
jgi:orotidine-5'-phosphate decarboxylase